MFFIYKIKLLQFTGSSLPSNQMIQPVSFAQNSSTENKSSGNLNTLQVGGSVNCSFCVRRLMDRSTIILLLNYISYKIRQMVIAYPFRSVTALSIAGP